ncbi:MAG: DedA family protein [Actinomycetes bacterium]
MSDPGLAIALGPELSTLTASAVYLVVFGFVFVESGLLVGVVLPGDTMLFAAGLVAASSDSGVSIIVLTAGAFLAAVAGDQVGYVIGRRAGRPYLLRRRGGLVNVGHVDKTERFYARYGWAAVVGARFVPWVRTVTPLLAGIGRMPYAQFMPANVVGALGWAVGIPLLGYASADLPWLRQTSLAVAGAFVVGSVAVGAVTWVRLRRPR